jgi:signal transduction histidine kinase
VNIPVIAMAMAAGISIDAALAHGLIGVRRRPLDAVRIAFALQALAVAAGALAIIALYSADSARTHFEVMKWVLFPAALTWWVAAIWLVAFYTGVRPLRWLLALSAGFCALIALNLVLPYGVLHRVIGSIATSHMAGADVSVMVAPTPHPIYHVVSALTLAAFVTMFYAAWRVHRRHEPGKAWTVTAFLFVFLVAGVLDALQNYGILSDLYYTQLSFVILVLGVNVGLRQESLRQEDGLLANRAHLESLVEQRVKDVDAADARLALESQERLATAESLRRRVAELDALHRISRTLAERVDLRTALDQAALEIASLLTADHARIDLAGGPPATLESTGHLMVVPLVTKELTLGALSIARDQGAPFSDEERRLAETVAGDVAAAAENERLHERQTRLAAEEERQRLARDLHDAVTQTLYSAALIAEALPTVWQRQPSAGLSNLARLQLLVRAAHAEMRTLLFELRPATLEATPLAALLDRLGDALAGKIDGPVSIRTANEIPLSSATKLAFYRVTQEAFNNIAKHARASQVDVECGVDGHGVVSLSVRDDGGGFDPGTVEPDRIGLRIMRERLDSVGASLEIDSKPGSGTTITAVWPGRAQSPQPAEGEHERSTTH